MTSLPYGKHYIDSRDIEAVVEVLRSDWLTTGPKVVEFENDLAARVGARYVVTFSSGTAALHAAYAAAGVGPDDEVITSPITFAATANAACYLGAKPVFVDVQTNTINIEPAKVKSAITRKTKVIAPVDFTGQPASLDEIMKIATEHELVVVEDAAHALGATYKGRSVGSISDMTIFSFHPVKHITTGEGGAVATNNEKYYRKLLSFRSHGIVREKGELEEYYGPWYHEMQFLGYNYRLTDFQCALGISQLKKIDSFLDKRRLYAQFYQKNLSEIEELRYLEILPYNNSAWHLYVVLLMGEDPPRRQVYEALHEKGIGVQVHYIPVYWHPYYRKMGYNKGLCPNAEDYYRRCITLPLFPSMQTEDVKRVIDELKIALNKGYN